MLKKPEERLIPEVLGKGWEAGLLLRGGGGEAGGNNKAAQCVLTPPLTCPVRAEEQGEKERMERGLEMFRLDAGGGMRA
jgi:hypothetical protein